MVLEHIRNFVLVMPNLATSGQPSETQLQKVAAAGFEVVINLGLLDLRYCLPNEVGLVPIIGTGVSPHSGQLPGPATGRSPELLLGDGCRPWQEGVHPLRGQ